MNSKFDFGDLVLNGTYNTTGYLGKSWLKIPLDSEGDKDFQVTLLDTVLRMRITVDAASACADPDARDIMITELDIPFEFDDVFIKFENLDEVFEKIIEGIIRYVLKTQNKELVTVLRGFLSKNMFGVLCL